MDFGDFFFGGGGRDGGRGWEGWKRGGGVEERSVHVYVRRNL